MEQQIIIEHFISFILSFCFLHALMTTCVIKDSVPSLLRYCHTIDTIQQIGLFACETMNKNCQSDSHTNSIQIDSTNLLENHELNKKRPFNRSNTYNASDESKKIVIDNSCSMPAVSKNINHETTTKQIRPTSLLLANVPTNRSPSCFRTCLSQPFVSSQFFPSINDTEFSPTKFTSLPTLINPSTKRFRSETLTLAPKNISISALSKTDSTSIPSRSLVINFIDSSELAVKLKENTQKTIFDCGSPIRHDENHICDSRLLRVSDRISRKRLKTNPMQHVNIDLEQLNESDVIILYDDSSDNHHEISAGLKCACEEIQRCLTTNNPSIYILKNSFNHFCSLYPNLCVLDDSSLKNDLLLSKASIHTSTLDIYNHPMTHIIDGVFIGSEANAKNLDELSIEHIRCIVNVTSHVPAYYKDRFHYYHIPADDTQKQNLSDHFDQVYEFIHKAIQNNKKVLVHCVAGISRSPAIVISFLMRYAKMNLNDAYEFVRQKRFIVSPNLNFMGQLLQYETKLKEQTIRI